MENRVREERDRRGISQLKLAALTGIAPQDIGAIEKGRRFAYPGWRRRLARALNCREADLFPAHADQPAAV